MAAKTVFPLLLAACLSGAVAAWAAEPTSGRITYIDPVGRRIMLDNAYMYRLGPEIDLSKLAVAERVQLKLQKGGSGEIVTEVTAQP
jgi:hypothetical protein